MQLNQIIDTFLSFKDDFYLYINLYKCHKNTFVYKFSPSILYIIQKINDTFFQLIYTFMLLKRLTEHQFI